VQLLKKCVKVTLRGLDQAEDAASAAAKRHSSVIHAVVTQATVANSASLSCSHRVVPGFTVIVCPPIPTTDCEGCVRFLDCNLCQTK
jgi:hypothetical protein